MLRKQALIAFTALGLTMGSGAALSAPVGLQGLPSNALIQEKGATVQPVHFRTRSRVIVHPQSRVIVEPRRHVLVHPRTFRQRHAFVQPRIIHRHPRFVHRHHARPRAHFSFGLGF
jgi:hypothetical protein